MKNYIAFFVLLFLFASCYKEDIIKGGAGLDDWSAETHGYGATPNYDVVFNQTKVNRIDIEIKKEYWELMQADLAALMANPPAPGESYANPIYVPCQVYFEDKQWYDVGIRYKGNSSLKNAYQQGKGKMPFRLEFDHFDNENPNINGQTFYGFTELAMSSNFKDNTYLHEKLAHDIFREFGVAAPRTAFYRVFVDYGDGPVYFGLYTMVEVVFDKPFMTKWFGGPFGNSYKPDGQGSKLNDPSLLTSTYFPNKTNSGVVGTDIQDLVSSLLADNRLSDPAAWRAKLEQYIDMEQYLKYLAANTTMKNWDTYGRMTHNYYLCQNSSSGKLTWVPWDNNEAFTNGPGGPTTALNFDFSNMETSPLTAGGEMPWPMISYVYADPVYKSKYDDYIDDFIGSVFTSANLDQRINDYHFMIEPYVTGAEGESGIYTSLLNLNDFTNSHTSLISYISSRNTEAANYTP